MVNNVGLRHIGPVEDFSGGRFSLMLRVMLEAGASFVMEGG